MSKRLIAKRPILFESKQYTQGDNLPAHDTKMVEAWIKHGSATWEQTSNNKQDSPSPVASWNKDMKRDELDEIGVGMGIDTTKAANKDEVIAMLNAEAEKNKRPEE